MKKLIAITMCILSLFACKEEEDPVVQSPSDSKRAVVILNEGNFRSANASIDVYYPQDNEHLEKIYAGNNDSRPLGDVAQSMVKINGEYWVVINNSNKIEIIDPSNFRSIGRVEGLNSPRYVQYYNSQKVYVSDLYEDKIYIVNPISRTVSGTIPTAGWTEEMLVHNNRLFVTHMDSNELWVIDAEKDSVINKISTPISPHALEIDANNKIWLACTGGFSDGNTALLRINPISLEIEETLSHSDIQKSIGDIALNPSKTQLYYSLDGIASISINDTTLASSVIIAREGRNFYAMDVDPFNGDIYLADAIDYQQRGLIYRYDSNGALIHQFNTGLIPGFFFFDN